jgi:hypothetical protein
MCEIRGRGEGGKKKGKQRNTPRTAPSMPLIHRHHHTTHLHSSKKKCKEISVPVHINPTSGRKEKSTTKRRRFENNGKNSMILPLSSVGDRDVQVGTGSNKFCG